ncbi:MAG: primosomal protein N' [Clostridia bacterium]|nr:primosomal protein N' [Clostridia bacterium]
MFAEVIVDIAHTAVDRRFTYRIPEGLPVSVGHHVLVPFGQGDRTKEGFVVALKPSADYPEIKDIAKIVERYPVVLPEQIELAEWMKESYHCLFVDALRLMIPAQMRGMRIKEKKVRTVMIPEGADTQSVLDALESAPVQKRVYELVAKIGAEASLPDLNAFYPGSTAAVNALVRKGFLIEKSETVFRRPGKIRLHTPEYELTEAQSRAADEIQKGVLRGAGDVFLLHGVTGSGKTEVYLRAIEDCLALNRQAIVLVPEISLTPQTVGRFTDRFGDRIAVLHSRLSAGERFDEWRRIRLGLADIVIGARSAVFAPLERLGLIIIDEEHESSYQSETQPRYLAGEVAARRVKTAQGALVLGSATPSMMSYTRALSGKYRLLELPDRVAGRPLPTVEVVNMRDELLMGNNSIFSDRLTERLSECLAANQQAMLFINRRGYATFVSCRNCGYVLKCDNCDISMTYHKSESRTRCHYCGAVKPLPKECPNCKKPFIKQFGIGTEQVEEAVHKLFPAVRTLRMDTDTMREKGSYEKLLSAFHRGEAQVLIGTQMIAKGHDFPNVTLVGVVAADTTLNLPDYRAPERTFQLLTQVAGRAGRDNLPGRVVLQTYEPNHPIIRFAKAQDYVSFYHYEIAERKKMLYPPFSLFLRIVFADRDERKAEHACLDYAKALEAELRAALGEDGKLDLLLLVAAEAPISRISGYTRYQILIKLLRTKRLKDAVRTVTAFHDAHRDVCAETQLEINPQEMF